MDAGRQNRSMLTTVIGLALSLAQAEVQKDLVYRTVGEVQVKADFYPPLVRPAGPAPFVLVVHGGGWTGGRKEDMAEICRALSQAGVASATVQYRLAPRHRWPAQIEDVQAAVRYFRSNAAKYGIDGERMGAIGASAGGHLSLLLGTVETLERDTRDFPGVSSRVQAVVNIFGPTDLANDFDLNIAGFVSMSVMGVAYDPEGAVVRQFSPVTHVTAASAPVFTIHGEEDRLVPVEQARRLDRALRAAGVEHVMRLIPGMGHEISQENAEARQAIQDSAAFLLRHLGKPTLLFLNV